MVRNARPEARILLSEDVNGQEHQYRHMILLGDNSNITSIRSPVLTFNGATIFKPGPLSSITLAPINCGRISVDALSTVFPQ